MKVRDDDRRGAPAGKTTMMIEANGGIIGNPPFVPTDEQRALVLDLSKRFPHQGRNHIATIMGISVSTLDKYFSSEMAMGRAQMLAAVAGQLINRAIHGDANGPDGKPLAKGDLDAQKFILARMGGWSMKAEISLPPPDKVVDLDGLEVDELREAIPVLRAIVDRMKRANAPEQAHEPLRIN
jgi:hypothetical protein